MDKVPVEIFRQFVEQGVPFNHWLGMKVTQMVEGDVEIRVPYREEIVGDPFRPALHGGVTAAALDAVGGAALFTQLGFHDKASTVDLRVDYLKPGQCKDFLIRGKVIRLGNRVATVQMTAWHEGHEADPFAIAIGVYNVRRSSHKLQAE